VPKSRASITNNSPVPSPSSCTSELQQKSEALEARTPELRQKTAEVEQLRSQLNSLEQRLAVLEQARQGGSPEPR